MKTPLRIQKDREYENPKKSLLELENMCKGMANHYKIQTLFILYQHSGLTLDQITELLGGNFKTISVHVKRLSSAGLISKKYKGNFVQHSLTESGKKTVLFLKSFI